VALAVLAGDLAPGADDERRVVGFPRRGALDQGDDEICLVAKSKNSGSDAFSVPSSKLRKGRKGVTTRLARRLFSTRPSISRTWALFW
jgi:hypothetical protein